MIRFSPIRQSSECPIAQSIDGETYLAMAPGFSDEQKLAILQRLDQFRQWRSLDDKRYCLVCDKVITGRQVEISGGVRGCGPQRLNCPTERCNSIPMDWVLPTDEMLAKAAATAVKNQHQAALRNLHRYPHQEDSLASRFQKFAMFFKRPI